MTKTQYRIANKMVYFVLLGVMGYIILSLGITLGSGAGFSVMLQFMTAIAGTILATVGFLAKREEKAGAIMIVLGPTIVYFVMMCTNNTPQTIIYALPIMLASLVYLNARLMLAGDAVVIIGSFIQIVRLTSFEGNDAA